MELLKGLHVVDDKGFESRHDPRGFFIHSYPSAEILMTDTLLPGAKHLAGLYQQDHEPRHVLLDTPNVRQVGTHLGPQLFAHTGHMFASCAWILPDTIPMIVLKEMTRHINTLFPFDIFRYREQAEDWLAIQVRKSGV